MNQAKEFFQKMDYEQKIFFCCKNGNASSFAYQQLLENLEAATMQMNRIWSYAKSITKTQEPDQNDPNFQAKALDYMKTERNKNRRLFIDIHFYFVSWGNIRAMMAVLSKQPEFKDANILFNSHRKIIEHYINARNVFEHFEQRLQDGRNHSRVIEVQAKGAGSRKIFKGISKDGYFLHSDKKWDIKPSSLDKLDKIVMEFVSKIHESLDFICEQKSI